MDKEISGLIVYLLILSHSLSGCNSDRINQNIFDSPKVDSLIRLRKINDRTAIVNLGYDAVTAIKTTKGIVLVDAGISTLLTSKYRRTIENVFQQNDFIYVINTHCHPDHIAGNGIFSHARVVGHENCLIDISGRLTNRDESMKNLTRIVQDYDEKLLKSEPDSPEWKEFYTQKIRYMEAFSDLKNSVPVKLPDITFSDSMKIDLGDTTLEMIYFGKFHSDSDILIYVPETGVLFTGDLFSKYGRPGMSNTSVSDKERWMQSIRWIKRRTTSIETIIDGHGQILSIDDLGLFTKNLSSRGRI